MTRRAARRRLTADLLNLSVNILRPSIQLDDKAGHLRDRSRRHLAFFSSGMTFHREYKDRLR